MECEILKKEYVDLNEKRSHETELDLTIYDINEQECKYIIYSYLYMINKII